MESNYDRLETTSRYIVENNEVSNVVVNGVVNGVMNKESIGRCVIETSKANPYWISLEMIYDFRTLNTTC